MLKKNIFKLLIVLTIFASSCGEDLTYQEPDDNTFPLRVLVNKYYKNSDFFIGAQAGKNYLTDIKYSLLQNVFYREFTVNTVVNQFNQQLVYPLPNKEWFDGNYNYLFDSARKNMQVLSIDIAMSNDCSDWIKDESSNMHTVENISNTMNYYISKVSREAERNKDIVKWITVIKNPVSLGHTGLNYDGTNATISYNAGEWLSPVAGITYENPWTVLGFSNLALNIANLNEPRIPNYILDAFKITNKEAPSVKQIITQSDDKINENVWNTIKQLVFTLRNNNIRVDGIGWIAKLDLEKGFKDDEIRKLSLLIDWCYQNSVEFHIQGLELRSSAVNRWNKEDLDGLKKKEQQISEIITPIAKLMIQKAGKGAVSLNYGIFDGRYDDINGTYASLFDHDGGKRQTYIDLQKILSPELIDK